MLHPKYAKAQPMQFWPALIAAGGALLGGHMANEANKDIADDTSKFNAAQAALNREYNAEEAEKARTFSAQQATRAMDFSAEMSNTQWRRGVKDMQAAGLNPMLAFSQGGASSPAGVAGSSAQASGSAATGVSTRVNDIISPAIASAQQFRTVNAQIENTNANTDLLKAQRDKASQEAINAGSQNAQIVAQTANLNASTRELATRERVNIATIEEKIQSVKESFSREDLNRVKTQLATLSIAEAKVMEKFFSSGFGESSPLVKFVMPILQMILRGRGVN